MLTVSGMLLWCRQNVARGRVLRLDLVIVNDDDEVASRDEILATIQFEISTAAAAAAAAWLDRTTLTLTLSAKKGAFHCHSAAKKC